MSGETFMTEHLGQLVGGQITHVLMDSQDERNETFGLRIYHPNTGKVLIAWIMADAEENGPGHLTIESEG